MATCRPDGLGPVPRDASGIEARLGDRALEAGPAEPAHLALPHDVRDPAMSQLEQVGRRQAGTAVVVVRHHVDGEQTGLASSCDDGRDLARQRLDLVEWP